MLLLDDLAPPAQPNVLGPVSGYSPHLGCLISQLGWMRAKVVSYIKGWTVEQLDFLLDSESNRAGALLLHLAATEVWYQLNTFDGLSAQEVEESPAFQQWKVAADLGEPARQSIHGHPVDYYVRILQDVRERSLEEFRKRDDDWLFAVDHNFPWGPTNNLCKWFHVAEHESNHCGQIVLIRNRFPASRPGA